MEEVVPVISVVIPITDARYDDVAEVFAKYKSALVAHGRSFEFTYVLDGEYPELFQQLMALRERGEDLRIIKLSHWFGESAALSMGFTHANGDIVLTLPAFLQGEPDDIPKVLESLSECDLAVARRRPRTDSWLKRIQSAIFHFLLRTVSDVPFHDLGSGIRAIKRKVIQEIELYGDMHRFLPLLALRQGFRVKEVEIRQASKSSAPLFYSPGIYLRRLLDILSVLFIVKFTKKPLRFFGLLGGGLFGLGTVTGMWVLIQKIWLNMPMADRPLILVPATLLTLGVQFLAIGLIGEIIIFTHAGEFKDYAIEEIVN